MKKLKSLFSIFENIFILLISIGVFVWAVYSINHNVADASDTTSYINLFVYGILVIISGWVAFNRMGLIERGKDPTCEDLMAEIEYSVQFDDVKITVSEYERDDQELLWEDIDKIIITFADVLLPMPIWCMGDDKSKNGICIPNDAKGLNKLMDEFSHRLPGYDNPVCHEVVIAAMGAIEGVFEVWERSVSTKN